MFRPSLQIYANRWPSSFTFLLSIRQGSWFDFKGKFRAIKSFVFHPLSIFQLFCIEIMQICKFKNKKNGNVLVDNSLNCLICEMKERVIYFGNSGSGEFLTKCCKNSRLCEIGNTWNLFIIIVIDLICQTG